MNFHDRQTVMHIASQASRSLMVYMMEGNEGTLYIVGDESFLDLRFDGGVIIDATKIADLPLGNRRTLIYERRSEPGCLGFVPATEAALEEMVQLGLTRVNIGKILVADYLATQEAAVVYK